MIKPKHNQQRSFGQKLWFYSKRILLFLFITHLLYIIVLKWVNPPITITQFVSWISGDGLKRDYVAGNEVSPYMKLAVISSEDQIFPDHSGFDWKHIKKAMENNEKEHARVKGASTISQQVAKNVFLWQGGGFLRKGLEAYFTKMIEWIWGKQRILEVYVNVIEMGRGIYGAEAAAQAYFGKPAKSLTKKEAAMIAACLPNPKKFTVKPVHQHIVSRTPWVISQMNYLEKDAEVKKLVGE